MKNILLAAMLFTMVNLAVGQQNVVLDVNHLIGTNPLVYGTIYNTDNGIYKISRIQCYMSGIELVHDGGQVLPLTGTYLILDGTVPTYNLGAHNVTNIEEIRFNIGVDSLNNHEDPSIYPTGHALAPQLPSLHWGWTAGYMFVNIDGEADGTNSGAPNTTMEFRAVGDQYLTPVVLNTTTATLTSGNTTTIYINADYDKFFEGVTMATIYHGAGGPINRLIANINNWYLFTAANVTSVTKIPTIVELSIAPNPATEKAVVTYHFETANLLNVVVTDQLGRVVKSYRNLSNQGTVELITKDWESGLYNYSFYEESRLVATRQLAVQ